MSLRKVYKIKRRSKVDTDRYEMHFRIVEDPTGGISKCVWEEDPFVGPDAYNHGHIDFVLSNSKNDADTIIDTNNPIFLCRATLSKHRIKFDP